MTKHPLSVAVPVIAGLVAIPSVAHASFLPPEKMDAMATYVAWFVICVMPLVGIAIFWMVHVMPEKIAEKRHHPQAPAIKVLCLLSLVFGGLLWPLAWLWAYARPTSYRLAYGTDKSDEYFVHMAERAQAGELETLVLEHLREELDAIAERGFLSLELKQARAAIAKASPANSDTKSGAASTGASAPATSANGAA